MGIGGGESSGSGEPCCRSYLVAERGEENPGGLESIADDAVRICCFRRSLSCLEPLDAVSTTATAERCPDERPGGDETRVVVGLTVRSLVRITIEQG